MERLDLFSIQDPRLVRIQLYREKIVLSVKKDRVPPLLEIMPREFTKVGLDCNKDRRAYERAPRAGMSQ